MKKFLPHLKNVMSVKAARTSLPGCLVFCTKKQSRAALLFHYKLRTTPKTRRAAQAAYSSRDSVRVVRSEPSRTYRTDNRTVRTAPNGSNAQIAGFAAHAPRRSSRSRHRQRWETPQPGHKYPVSVRNGQGIQTSKAVQTRA